MDYDVIGDIHGHAGALETLLTMLGYRQTGPRWTPPSGRKAIFIGDFIDRGPRQLDTIAIVRRMIDDGDALAVMGNHELNAIAWHRGYRPRSTKNWGQHGAFLDSVSDGSPLHSEMIDWFLTLPLWLDLPELRVVHACWDERAMDVLAPLLDDGCLPESLVARATTGDSSSYRVDGTRHPGDPVFHAIETLTKGLEADLPGGLSIRDKDGFERPNVRLKWWMAAPVTYAEASFLPDGFTNPILDTPISDDILSYAHVTKPTFIGHYWFQGVPTLLSPHLAGVDYSVGKGGPLVAYRHREGTSLTDEAFISTR